MIRRLTIMICIIGIVSVLVCACSGEEKEQIKNKTLDVSAVFDSLVAEAGFENDMMKEDNISDDDGSFFEGSFDVRYSSYVDEYCYTAAEDGAPYELLLVSLKNNDEAYVKSRLNKYVEKRVASFEVYNPDWTDTMKNAIVASKGGYVLLVSSDNNSKVKAAFDKLFD